MLTQTVYHEISFPDLGISLNPSTGINIGSFSIRWYGVLIALGLCLAVIYGMRRSKRFGITQDDLLDGVLWIVPFAILCARAYYCVFSWASYRDNPIEVLYIWKGGLAIYGGVIGAAIGVFVFCKFKKIKPMAVLDLVLIGFLIGQSIGRWGNFFNREAFGGETEFFLRMGLTDSRGYTIFVHPTFLYESLWNFAGFLLLHFQSKRREYDGQTSLLYMAWYGLGRTFIEGLRSDSLYLGDSGIRVSQLLSAALFVVAVGLLIYNAFRKHDPEQLFVNQYANRLVLQREEEEARQATAESSAPEEAPARECPSGENPEDSAQQDAGSMPDAGV